jgi:hypothetical protein
MDDVKTTVNGLSSTVCFAGVVARKRPRFTLIEVRRKEFYIR